MTDLTAPTIEDAIGIDHERQRMRATLTQIIHQIDIDERLRTHAIQQAILEATAGHWIWRAEQFLGANRPDIAQACLNKAAFITWEAGGELEHP